MKRFTVRRVSNALNWCCVWDRKENKNINEGCQAEMERLANYLNEKYPEMKRVKKQDTQEQDTQEQDTQEQDTQEQDTQEQDTQEQDTQEQDKQEQDAIREIEEFDRMFDDKCRKDLENLCEEEPGTE